MSKISDKTDEFLINYRNLFWGPFFIQTQTHIIFIRHIVKKEHKSHKKYTVEHSMLHQTTICKLQNLYNKGK